MYVNMYYAELMIIISTYLIRRGNSQSHGKKEVLLGKSLNRATFALALS